jgi:NADH-ubiquinone oxidoreductase chain 6
VDNLYITYETLTNGYKPIFLDTVSILSIISGIFVIITRNPILKIRKLLNLWEKLSNSGEVLKLMIPSNNRKVICG